MQGSGTALMPVSKARASAGLLVRWGDGCGPQPPSESAPGLEHAAQPLLGTCQARACRESGSPCLTSALCIELMNSPVYPHLLLAEIPPKLWPGNH